MKEGKNLVIVESPAKAGTIQKFLGNDFVVKSSFGHIRDLHDSELSIDVENGFKPEYVIPTDKKKVVTELKKAAKEAKTVWLASDEDREGEAISWHLFETLGLDAENTRRIVFHEITKNAILNAIENPREIDMNLVNAQQARRVLDRLVGFELSPVLWRKIQPKLSAGRVQSVALRLVVDREREILAFKNEQYYRIDALFHPAGTPDKTLVKATLDKRFPDLDSAREFLEKCIGAEFSICSIDKKEGTRTPAAPFTTSTLQQEAARKLRLSVSQTMSIAQRLYEHGLITYMRTDSTNLSSLAINTSKKFICDNFYYSGQGNCEIRAKRLRHAAVLASDVSRMTVKNCTFRGLGGNGLQFVDGASAVTVEGNCFEDIGMCAVTVGNPANNWVGDPKNRNFAIRIENNAFRHIAYEYPSAPCIYIGMVDTLKILRNTIEGCAYSAMSVGWRWSRASFLLGEDCNIRDAEIAYNYIHNYMDVLRDGGAIYVLGGNVDPDYCSDRFNRMHDNYAALDVSRDMSKYGYYCDGSASNWDVFHNVIIGCLRPLFSQCTVATAFAYHNHLHDTYSNTRVITQGSHAPERDCLIYDYHLVEEGEDALFEAYPVAAEIKRRLMDNGALGAMMSGSGPSVFGIFDTPEAARIAAEAIERMGVKAHICAPV